MREFINKAFTLKEINTGPVLKEQLLIQGYLFNTPPLHLRRTLDQYYYYAINTGARDQDQVVWRYCKSRIKQRKLFMVDQLWLWILSDGLHSIF